MQHRTGTRCPLATPHPAALFFFFDFSFPVLAPWLDRCMHARWRAGLPSPSSGNPNHATCSPLHGHTGDEVTWSFCINSVLRVCHQELMMVPASQINSFPHQDQPPNKGMHFCDVLAPCCQPTRRTACSCQEEAALPLRPMDPVFNIATDRHFSVARPHHCRQALYRFWWWRLVRSQSSVSPKPPRLVPFPGGAPASHPGDDGLQRGPTFPLAVLCACYDPVCSVVDSTWLLPCCHTTFSSVRRDLGTSAGPVCRWPWCVALRKHGPNKPVWLPVFKRFAFATSWPPVISRRIFPAYLPIISRANTTTTTTFVTTQRAGQHGKPDRRPGYSLVIRVR